jgi:hypothetical protein
MLDIEITYLESHRDALLQQYGGKFLVIKGEVVAGAFETMTDALQGAATQYGLQNVLVRRASDTQMQVSIPALTLGILNADVSHTDSSKS